MLDTITFRCRLCWAEFIEPCHNEGCRYYEATDV